MKAKDFRIVMFFYDLAVKIFEAIMSAVSKKKGGREKDDNGNRHTGDYKTF